MSRQVQENMKNIDEGFGFILVYCDQCVWRESVDDRFTAIELRHLHQQEMHDSNIFERAYYLEKSKSKQLTTV